MAAKYPFPAFLEGRVHPLLYSRWLQRKAMAHRKRDRSRGNADATLEQYKVAIHAAVVRSEGVDAYTGAELRWELISQYDNDESKAGGRQYKQRFGDLPSVDHVGDGLGAPDFAICAWRTNDAKNDLAYEDFVTLCKAVVSYADTHRRLHA